MSCTWRSPWLMLSPLWCFRDGRGIGDVNRDGRLSGIGEASDSAKAFWVLLHCLINVIAFECDHNGYMGCWSVESGGKVFSIAFIDCLAKGNSTEGDEIGVDGGVHQNQASGARGEKRSKKGRNVSFELPARLDVLCALDV